MKRIQDTYTQYGDDTAGKFPLGSALFVVSVFFMTFIGRAIFSPLLLSVEADMGISHAEGGTIFLYISVGLMLTMLGSGFLLQHIRHHMNIALAVIVSGAALIFVAVVRDYFWFRVGLFFVGAGSGLYLPSGIVVMTELVPKNKRGIAIAIHELGPILGMATGPIFADIALRFADWRSLILVLGVVSLVVGTLFARFGRGGRFHGTSPRWRELRIIMKKRDFWILTFLFIMTIGHEMGIYSMLPAFLVSAKGMDQTLANTLVSTSRLTSLLMIFTAGWFADRFGFRRAMAISCIGCGLVTTLFGIGGGWILVAAIYVQPMLVSSFFPAGFIAMSGIVSAKQRNLPISLVIPISYLFGGGMIPAFIGSLAEHGYFGAGFVTVGLILVIGTIMVPLLKTTHNET